MSTPPVIVSNITIKSIYLIYTDHNNNNNNAVKYYIIVQLQNIFTYRIKKKKKINNCPVFKLLIYKWLCCIATALKRTFVKLKEVLCVHTINWPLAGYII